MHRPHLFVLAACAGLACGSESSQAPTGSGGATSTGTSTSSGAGGAASTGWWALAPLPEPLQENAVVALGGEVFIVGGFDDTAQVVPRVEAYDPGEDRWRSAAPLPAPRHHVNAAVVDGTLYVVGALSGLDFTAVGDVWAYEPEVDAWSERTPMPAGTERGGSAVGVIDGVIYVAGGFRGGDAVADLSAYDPATDSWELLPDLPAPRDHLVGGAIAGLLLAVGGRSGGIEGVQGRVDVFDPIAGSWSGGAPMPTARGGCAAASLEGRLFVLGGEGNPSDPSGVFPQVEAYDPVADAWTAHPPMRTPRHGTGAATIGGTVYVPGGATTQAFGAVDTVEAYRP